MTGVTRVVGVLRGWRTMSRSDCRPARRVAWGSSLEEAGGVAGAAGWIEGWGVLREGTASSSRPFTANLQCNRTIGAGEDGETPQIDDSGVQFITNL